MLGRFLEFSVRTTDIVESLGFYKLLGFHELEVGDVWTHKYAVVSDGDICIGLHDREHRNNEHQGPALTFVHQELAKEARSMTDHGFDFAHLQLDEDTFNELGLVCRDGHLINMIEARTFSPPTEDLDNSLCGQWFEITLPVRDSVRAARFWAPLAPELLRVREEPTTHMRFNAAEMSLGLSESIALTGPSLCFRCNDREEIWIALAKHGFAHKEFPGFEGAFMSVTAPEGTPLFLFNEDFLGELYEVEETDEPPPK
jgi:hypothetical protein